MFTVMLAIRLAQQLPVGLPSMGGPDYIDEMAELKRGNTAVAIVLGATILAMVLLVVAVVMK